MSNKDFDPEEREVLTALNVVGGVLSLCGSMFIIATYYRYRELQKLSFKLIVFIAIADFMTSLAKCFGSPSTGSFGCGLQGFLTTFGDLASILWVFILSAVMYGIMFNADLWIANRNESSIFLGNKQVSWKYIHGAIWTTSLILSLLPFTLEEGYSNTGGKCWISHKGEAQVFSWLCFYIWLWLVFIIIAVLYYKIYKQMTSLQVSTNDVINDAGQKQIASQSARRTANRIRWYPAVLFICFFWATFRRVWNFSGTDSPFWIVCLRVFFAALYGFCNALVYGVTIYNNLNDIKAKKSELGDLTRGDDQEMTQNAPNADPTDAEQGGAGNEEVR